MTFRQIGSDEEVDLDRKIAVIDSVAVANIAEAIPTYVQFEDGIACDPDPMATATRPDNADIS